MDNKGITGSFNVNSFNKIVHTAITDDRNQVRQWLSPLEPQKRHQHLRGSRLEGVGGWIFQTSQFQKWNTRKDRCSHSVLFCHGDPGVGKTHLSSVVIDHFYGRRQEITVAGLYCDYLDRTEQTTSNMLGAMLKQLVGGTIPEDIRKAYEDAKEHFGGVGPDVPGLLRMLKMAIAQRRHVIICIDGLDESLAVHRTGLLRTLQAIVRELPNVRLFLTGRPFIRGEVESYFPGMDAISVSPTREDIEEFLRMKLDEDTEPDAMDENLRADIMEIIPKTISEIFLLVSLSIETILEETTIHRRRKKLNQMSIGRDAGDGYTSTLERIRAQRGDRARLGMEAIMWVAYSERPLQPDELCQALGIEIGSRDLNSDNTPSIQTILNCALGLVTVDSSSSKIRLFHFTLQEHILANPSTFDRPHSMIAEVCLTYLNFKCIRGLSPALPSPPPTSPFLEYASCYWGAHARKQTSASVIPLALKLLDRFDAHISCKLLLLKEFDSRTLVLFERKPIDIAGNPVGFTGLHGASLLGVVNIIVPLLKVKKWDFNATDLGGNTALLLATKRGHDEIVQLLLEQESLNPNALDRVGRRALQLAVWGWREGIVEMLLGRNDADPNRGDSSGRTVLSWAAGGGRERMVETLLHRSDVDPNTPDNHNRTPVLWAVKNRHERIVRLLLKQSSVDPDSADESGRTPLSWAIGACCEGIVEMLLERDDVNPSTRDKRGRTPLSWAAENGHEGCVSMLLQRNDVSPNTADKHGQTPISLAVKNRNERIVKLLLQRKDLDLNSSDKSGRTPLSWAVENRDTGIVRLLLGQNDVNPDSADMSGRTPFSWVAAHGFPGIATMLLGRNDVNPDSADKSGRTPLSWAAEHECTLIVRMLLERNDIDPNSSDRSGRTPLSWAAGAWSAKSVAMLLERNRVNPSTADRSGRTPFSWAAQSGCERIVELLLERNNVNPDSADKSGRTPLSWAAMFGREKITRMLLEQNCARLDTADESGRMLCSWAAKSGYKGIVSMLLDQNNANPERNINPNMANESGRTSFPRPTENSCMRAFLGQGEWHDPNAILGHQGGLSESFVTEPSPPPEPPLKKIRLF